MSWIPLFLLLNQVTGAASLSPPSNTPSSGSNAAPASRPSSIWAPPDQSLARPSAASERADPGLPNEFAAHPVTIEWRLGVGTPTGVIGGALSYSPIPALGLDCGAGSNTHGLQLACGLRARLVLDGRQKRGSLAGMQQALTLTSGLSTGPYIDSHTLEKFTAADGPGPASRSYQRANWWNTDLGVEGRYEGLVLRFVVGAALLLNPDAGTDVVTGSERIERPTTSLVYVGFGVGLAP